MSSEVKKTIVINKVQTDKRSTTAKKPTAPRIKPNAIIRPNTLKKTLLDRIKLHQKRQSEHRNNGGNIPIIAPASLKTESDADKQFSNEFAQSMSFLQNLATKRRQNNAQRTMKHREHRSRGHNVSVNNNTMAAVAAAAAATAMANYQLGVQQSPSTMMMQQPQVQLQQQQQPPPPPPPHDNIFSSFIQQPTQLQQQPMIPMPLVSIQAVPPTPPTLLTPSPVIEHVELSIPPTSHTVTPPHVSHSSICDVSSSQDTSKSTPDESFNPTNDNKVTEDPDVTVEPPSIFIKQDPPHGCLKGGSKPTFREWLNKFKASPVNTITEYLHGGEIGSNDDSTSNKKKADDHGDDDGWEDVDDDDDNPTTKKDSSSRNNTYKIDPNRIKGVRMKIRQTVTKKFRVGKHNNSVGVLIKNKETQKHLQKEHLSLKQKSINEIKKFLYDKSLLKIGSNAPPDVLRRMYEDAILTGDVVNTGSGVVLHNFLSNEH
jgi:hypothetical protein